MLWIFFIDVERENNLNMQCIKKLKFILFFCFVLVFTLSYIPKTFAVIHERAEVKTESGGLVTKIAPGEFLPIYVKLTNFGGGRRVDVTIDYLILDSNGEVIAIENETVAVETTASYVKFIQIPHSAMPGIYMAESSIVYQGQEVPATSSYQFSVERKIAGIFASQFILYGIITLAVGVVFAVVSRLVMKRRRTGRIASHEYLDVPKHDRLFYEIISDTIAQMRYRVGDRAIELAFDIDGLVIDKNTGRVLKLTKNPAKIIALLVLRYENELGEKVSFALRKIDEETTEKLKPVDKNLVIIRKYFSEK